MVTIHREAGFRFVIYVDDHEPPHVHVIGDGTMKVVICGEDGKPELIKADRMKSGDIRKAVRIVIERQEHFMEC